MDIGLSAAIIGAVLYYFSRNRGQGSGMSRGRAFVSSQTNSRNNTPGSRGGVGSAGPPTRLISITDRNGQKVQHIFVSVDSNDINTIKHVGGKPQRGDETLALPRNVQDHLLARVQGRAAQVVADSETTKLKLNRVLSNSSIPDSETITVHFDLKDDGVAALPR